MLDPAFKFSQHSLNDFVECPRRFYLKYVARQPWPLVESGPLGLNPLEYQAYLWRGVVLHRWIERYWLGVPPAPSVASDDTELNVWWARFMATSFADLPATRLPELALVAPLGSELGAYSLYARFDLLAIDSAPESPAVQEPANLLRQAERAQKPARHPEGSGEPAEPPVEGDWLVSERPFGWPANSQDAPRAVIIDWKTLRGERPPRYQVFVNRLQTRIYLYVLATAGAAFNGGVPFVPEQCRMRYWLANFPEQPWVDIPYSAADYERDGRMLLQLMDSAAQRASEEEYELTPDERHCTYCTYRTLCRRKGVADASPPAEQWLDIEAAGEIDY